VASGGMAFAEIASKAVYPKAWQILPLMITEIGMLPWHNHHGRLQPEYWTESQVPLEPLTLWPLGSTFGPGLFTGRFNTV
jgi:hypothetical protein